LKRAFDALNEAIFADYSALMRDEGIDPLKARDEYIKVELGMLDFSQWISEQAGRSINAAEQERIQAVLKVQFISQKMFTSCGWFFDALDRIEPQNNIRFAANSAALMQRITGKKYSEMILPLLREAVSMNTGRSAADDFVNAYQQFLGQ